MAAVLAVAEELSVRGHGPGASGGHHVGAGPLTALGLPPSLELVEAVVDAEKVVEGGGRGAAEAAADDIPLGVSGARRGGLVDADPLEAAVHHVQEARGEGREEVERLAP